MNQKASVPWVIRSFQPQDQVQVKALYRATVAQNPHLYYRPLDGPQLPDDVAGNFAQPNDLFYVARVADEGGDKVVGMCGFKTLPDNPLAGSIVNGTLDPAYRGLGIYKALYEVRGQELKRRGIETLYAITSCQNIKMADFLRRQGFEDWEPDAPVTGFLHLVKQETIN